MTKITIHRHAAWVRVTHWINAAVLAVMLMSGLQIFNAHPALYFGLKSDFAHPWLALADGFPKWITLPHYQDLATGRRWHFFFAWLFVLNGSVYLALGVINGHIRKGLLPSRVQLAGVRRAVIDHLKLRFPQGEEARRYNVLQKLTYLLVIFVLLPLIVLTGMTMSPALDSAFPFLLDVFGGRQSARTIHFLAASLLALFTLVHVIMVVLSGLFNNVRSMITGRYVITQEASDGA
ncbi:MAG: cytochrome b/b6 domain-containing protein [Acetobacteraceae bacterium]|nr:cytochrome b/b6 domain-containing protein [Acetobacteraceae bacterium]